MLNIFIMPAFLMLSGVQVRPMSVYILVANTLSYLNPFLTDEIRHTVVRFRVHSAVVGDRPFEAEQRGVF